MKFSNDISDIAATTFMVEEDITEFEFINDPHLNLSLYKKIVYSIGTKFDLQQTIV